MVATMLPATELAATLNATESETLKAIVARIIPADENGPGALEAHADRYIDRALGGALALGLGIAVLSNSRPYEGMFFCLPVAAVFLWWLAGKTKPVVSWSVRFYKVALPLALSLAANLAFIGYYNWRATGSPRTFAMSLNQRFYDPSAIFMWETPGPPMRHNNPQFDEFYNH